MEEVPVTKKKDPTIYHTHKPTAPTENLQLPRKGPRDSLQLPQVHSSAFCIPETRLFCYRKRHFTSLKGTKDVDTEEDMAKQPAPPPFQPLPVRVVEAYLVPLEFC
jgi:hypothetical protein